MARVAASMAALVQVEIFSAQEALAPSQSIPATLPSTLEMAQAISGRPPPEPTPRRWPLRWRHYRAAQTERTPNLLLM